jgi:WD40 repeat protein
MKTLTEVLVWVESLWGEGQLTPLQAQILRSAWEGKSYAEVATLSGYNPEYVKKTGIKLFQSLSEHLGRQITKKNLRLVLHALDPPVAAVVPSPFNPYRDWGEAPNTSAFVGRDKELNQLQQWGLTENCRLLAISGMGGIGKTLLAVKFAELVQADFEFVIWRSLRNAPRLEQIVLDWLQCLALGQTIDLQTPLAVKLEQLITHLQQHRCLLILDNCESILAGSIPQGSYRAGYENYAQLLDQLGQKVHQSCCLITGRELPQSLLQLGESRLSLLVLRGLEPADGRLILRQMGLVLDSGALSQQLLERYQGNPLSLNIIAATIQELFGGDVALFLEQAPVLFGSVYDLLAQQFSRLSELEQQVMYWLAINREWVSLAQLSDDLWPRMLQRRVMDALLSLQQRSLIEARRGYFTLQPVVMEFVTEQVLEQAEREILTGEFRLLNQLALIKAQISDYIRESQIRVIFAPLVAQLRGHYDALGNALGSRLQQLLQHLRSSAVRGYTAGNLLNLLRYLELDLTGYDFSGLAIWQAYLQGMRLQQVNLRGADLRQAVFTEKTAFTLGLAFSQDGERLATASDDGEVGVWEVITGKQLLSFRLPGWASGVTFSPNGKYLASTHSDMSVKVWDLQQQICAHCYQGATHPSRDHYFSADGQTLFFLSVSEELKVWNFQTDAPPRSVPLKGHSEALSALAISPEFDWVAIGYEDGMIKVWDLETGTCLQTLVEHSGVIPSMAFGADLNDSGARTLISVAGDGTIRFWNLTTGECWRTLRENVRLTLSLSPSGQVLATGCGDGTIKLWNLQTGELLKMLQGHQAEAFMLAFSPRDPILASCAIDGTLKLWNLGGLEPERPNRSSLTLGGQLGQCLRSTVGFASTVWSIAFSADSQRLASVGNDKLLRIWHPTTGECLQSLPGHSMWVWNVSFAPDGQTVATASLDGTQRLWNLETGTSAIIGTGPVYMRTAAFSPDGQRLAIRGREDLVELLDPRTGELLHSFAAPLDVYFIASFSPDSQFLACNCAGATVQLWQTDTWACQQILQGHRGAINSLAFHPQGQHLATGSDDGTVKLWDLNTGKCLKTFSGHQGQVWSVAFPPLGPAFPNSPPLLASAAGDGVIKLWDLESGECWQTLSGHSGEIRSLAFSPNGKRLASGSLDETMRLWDPLTWECLRVVRTPRPYEGMDITGVTGLTDAQKVTLKRLGAIEDGSAT